MTKKKETIEKCSLFEEMLMWTSYRYCIGRKSYVSSMANDIAQHYYNRLSDERKTFTANDIRKEIYDKLSWFPFKFTIHRIYNEDKLDPIDALLTFFEKENITSIKDLFTYSKIEYNSHTGEFTSDRCIPTITNYFSVFDIDDLLPWANLASCFDHENHKLITVEYDGKKEDVRCFKTWRRKLVFESEDNHSKIYHMAEFGWEPVWMSVDNFINGHENSYLREEYIKEIKNID